MDERKPLSNREYHTLRALFGIVSTFSTCAPDLKKRAEMIPGAWQDMQLIIAKGEDLMENLLGTIPLKKLLSMQKDLQNTVCEIKVKYNIAQQDKTDYVYVPAAAVDNLVARVMKWECLVCDKNAKQARKCGVYKDITDTYPWEFEGNGDSCPLAGYFIPDME